MNTVGRFFENKEKRNQASPDWSGKIVLTEPFLKALVEGWRAHRASGSTEPCEAKIEGRIKAGDNLTWINLTVIPPKVQS